MIAKWYEIVISGYCCFTAIGLVNLRLVVITPARRIYKNGRGNGHAGNGQAVRRRVMNVMFPFDTD